MVVVVGAELVMLVLSGVLLVSSRYPFCPCFSFMIASIDNGTVPWDILGLLAMVTWARSY